MSSVGFPILDIAPFINGDGAARRQVAKAFGRALEETGFIALTGHGVPEPLIQDTYDTVKEFFDLPLPEKMSYVLPDRAKTCGYLAVGIESVAATLDIEQPPDLCEALVFKSLLRERASAMGGVPGQGACNIWPTRPAGLAQRVNAYFDAVVRLSSLVNRMAAIALDLPEDFFEPYYRDPGFFLRFVNYPDQPKPPLPGQLRYGAHHDYGGFTILRQDAAPGGLQICDSAGVWHDVPAVPEAFIINIGELMSRWTNGRWRATLHRVINPPRELTGSTQRLSMVLFTAPDAEAEIACLPTCRSAAQPAKFAPVRAGAFVRAKLDKSMVDPVS